MRKRGQFEIVRAVLFALILREVRGRFGENRLGAFWFVAEPLAHVAAMMAIFSVLRGTAFHGLEYPVFLVSGLVPFLLFKNIVLKGMEAVNANKGLFAYRQIKPLDTIVSRCIVEFMMMACVYCVIIIGLGLWGGFDVIIHSPLRWVLSILVGLVFSFSLALLFCIVGDALPEIKSLLRLLFMPLYFISAIIFPVWLVPERFMKYILWNPYLHIVDSIRSATFSAYPDNIYLSIEYPISVSIIFLAAAMFLYRVKRLKLASL